MGDFIHRNYYILFGILLVVSLGCAFQLGVLRAGATVVSAVTLNCSDDVLNELAVPLTMAQTTSMFVDASDQVQVPTAASTSQGQFLGSKNGTKYYTPQCAAANRIKPENIIWFTDAQDAVLQGYTPANCQ